MYQFSILSVPHVKVLEKSVKFRISTYLIEAIYICDHCRDLLVITEVLVLEVGVATLDYLDKLVIPVHLVALASLDSPEYKVHLDLG